MDRGVKRGRGPGITIVPRERPQTDRLARDVLRDRIAQDIEDYLAKGGRITVVPPGVGIMTEDDND